MSHYFAGMTLSQAKALYPLNKLFLAQRAKGADGLALLSLARQRLGSDLKAVFAQQQANSWPLPILRALARVVASI